MYKLAMSCIFYCLVFQCKIPFLRQPLQIVNMIKSFQVNKSPSTSPYISLDINYTGDKKDTGLTSTCPSELTRLDSHKAHTAILTQTRFCGLVLAEEPMPASSSSSTFSSPPFCQQRQRKRKRERERERER